MTLLWSFSSINPAGAGSVEGKETQALSVLKTPFCQLRRMLKLGIASSAATR